MATMNDLAQIYIDAGLTPPSRFVGNDTQVTAQDIQNTQNHVNNLSGGSSSTSSGDSGTSGSTSTTSSAGQLSEQDILALFSRYGVNPSQHGDGSTLNEAQTQQRIQKIVNEVNSGVRTIGEVESAISYISQVTSGSGGAEPQNVTAQDVLAVFAEFGVEAAAGNETAEQRANRIVAEINAGFRTWGEFRQTVQDIAGGSQSNAGAPAPRTQALPTGAKLVKIGGEYRVVWSLGDGLGWAWYDITSSQLEDLFETSTPAPDLVLGSLAQFTAQFGDNYWGSVDQIQQNAETPWESLKDQIFAEFGYLPGLDDPEIQRLLLQGFFEGWSPNQFLAQYQQSDYFNTLADTQREWASLSEAEQATRIRAQAATLVEEYRRQWGVDPSGGINNPAIQNAAFNIASGVSTYSEWSYTNKREAEVVTDTPAARALIEQQISGRQPGVDAENLAKFAENQWRLWVGPVAIPNGFAEQWGKNLYENNASEADLENHLRQIASGIWNNKPMELTWGEWSAGYKSQIGSILELGSVDDNDPLLRTLLNQGMEGQDVVRAARHDPRFMYTETAYNELATKVTDIGRRFGFIT